MNLIYKYTLLLLAILPLGRLSAQFSCQDVKMKAHGTMAQSINNNAKSDTFDILDYQLNLDLRDIPSGNLSGEAQITFHKRLSVQAPLNLDLHQLNVDSMQLAIGSQAFSTFNGFGYNDSVIVVNLPSTLTASDTAILKIWYHGQPKMDVTGWGGVHRAQGYYYNLGVGFGANPHTFGRAWFPCFDNFVEKSSYGLEVKSIAPLRPLLTGAQQTEISLGGDTLLTSARLDQPIPTYLVSFALSNYEFINENVNGQLGNIPIVLAGKAADTLNLKASFSNLKPTLQAFETFFGPYEWPRIGYAITTVGAMEHATSISYPIGLVDGTLSGEDIMAHELAHHWWGNLVTCVTDAHMWISEGMAEFSSHVYKEQVYGRERYLSTVRDNAYNVLHLAHSRDNGYRSLVNLPHELVYGYHTYQKGAMVAHNMRHYLGDGQFFGGLQTLLQQNKFGNLNSQSFRDSLIDITGETVLNDFFDQWILNPGFPQFSVDSLVYDATNQSVTFEIEQRLYEAPNYFTNVPVDVTFFSESGDTLTRNFTLSGQKAIFTTSLPFEPKFAVHAFRGKLLTATSYDYHKITQNSSFAGKYAVWGISANNFIDSGAVLVMQHLAAPDYSGKTNFSFRLHPKRYFTVQKLGLEQTNIEAILRFNRNDWDDALLQNGNDSLVLMYRPTGNSPWEIYPYQNKKVGSSTSSVGDFELNQVLPGDYALANTASGLYLTETKNAGQAFSVYPNPAKGRATLRIKDFDKDKEYQLKICNAQGQILQERGLNKSKTKITLGQTKGVVFFWLNGEVIRILVD